MTINNKNILSFLTAVAVMMNISTSKADCVNPAGTEGDQVYNTTWKSMQYCDGTNWYAMAIRTDSTLWMKKNGNLYYTTGNVGIGTNTPVYNLDVTGNARVSGSFYLTGFTSAGVVTNTASGILQSTGLLPISLGGTNASTYSNGSVIFYNGTSLSQNNTKLYWDNNNYRLGVNTVPTTYNLEVSGTARITGNSLVGGTLGVTGDTTLGGILNVTGMSNLNGNAKVTGTLLVTSDATLQGKLGVTGDATMGNVNVGGTLGVTGATSLNNTLGVTGATSLHSTLTVDGASTLTGNTLVGGTFRSNGATTLDTTLAVGTNATVAGTLGVTGASTLTGNTSVGGTLTVTGAATLNNTLQVNGATTLKNTSVNGTLGVTGASTLTGNTTVGGTLGVTGATTLSSTLGVTGAATLSNTLDVTGASTLRSSVYLTTLNTAGVVTNSTGGLLSTNATLPVSYGGTGASTWTANKFIFSSAATTLANTSNIYTTGSAIGINVASPSYSLHATSANNTATIYGDNSSTGAGVYGYAGGSTGVYGGSGTNIGVTGYSASGAGGYFSSGTGYGLVVPTGNVGIGTASPTSALHIATTASSGGAIKIYNTSGIESSIGYYGASGDVWAAGAGAWSLAGKFVIGDMSNGGARLVIDQSGNVGIGTSTPISDVAWPSPGLEISGTRGTLVLRTSTAGNLSTLRFVGPTSGSDVHVNFNDSTGALTFGQQSGSINALTVAKTGNIGIGTLTPQGSLHIVPSTRNSDLILDGSAYADPPNIRLISNVSTQWNIDNLAGRFRIFTEPGLNVAGTEIFTLTSAGNVGISTASPRTRLDMGSSDNAQISFGPSSGGGYLYVAASYTPPCGTPYTACVISSNGNLHLDSGSNNGLYFNYNSPSAPIYTHSSLWVSSDRRWKRDIKTIDESLDKIRNIRGVYYYWNTDKYKEFKDNNKQIGVIAQEVEKFFPEAVNVDHSNNDFKSVAYDRLVAPLIEAVKELASRDDKKQQEIDLLKKQIEELKSEVNQLKQAK